MPRVAARVGSQRWVFLVMIVLAAGGAWLLARSWTRPLGAVTDALRRMPVESEPPPVLEPEGPPELRELGEAYLAVAAEVRGLRLARDTVASDVAHQLRTPLTTIGLRMEQLRAGVDAGDEAATRRNADIAAREITRLRQVVDGLLALRGGSATGLRRSEVDVAEVARERAAAWADLAREHGLRISVEAPESAPALATTRAAGQSLDNLIDNALEVAPPGSTVEVVVTAGRGQVIATVRDHGPGMSESERLHAFDRFWRGSHGSEGGLGIGLPIVADLMSASGGRSEIREAPRGGVDVVLTFEASGGTHTSDAGPMPVGRGAAPIRATRPLRVRIASGLLVSTGLVFVGTAAAATNALPPSLQHTAAGVLSRFGVSVPDPGGRPSTERVPIGSSRGRADAPGGGGTGDSTARGSSGAPRAPAATPATGTTGSGPDAADTPASTGATAPGASNRPSTPPGQSNEPSTPPGQSNRPSTPPGQSNKPSTPPGQSNKPSTPPGQSNKPSTPPGQAKKTTPTT